MSNDFDLDKIIQNVSNVKLPGGVVGKTCTVLIVVALAMACICWSVKIVLVSILAIIFLFIICFVTLWRLINFADRNPKAALLEGAEFLLHEQLLKLGTKNSPELTFDPKEVIEHHSTNLTRKELETAQRPDLPTPQGENVSEKSKGVGNE